MISVLHRLIFNSANWTVTRLQSLDATPLLHSVVRHLNPLPNVSSIKLSCFRDLHHRLPLKRKYYDREECSMALAHALEVLSPTLQCLFLDFCENACGGGRTSDLVNPVCVVFPCRHIFKNCTGLTDLHIVRNCPILHAELVSHIQKLPLVALRLTGGTQGGIQGEDLCILESLLRKLTGLTCLEMAILPSERGMWDEGHQYLVRGVPLLRLGIWCPLLSSVSLIRQPEQRLQARVDLGPPEGSTSALKIVHLEDIELERAEVVLPMLKQVVDMRLTTFSLTRLEFVECDSIENFMYEGELSSLAFLRCAHIKQVRLSMHQGRQPEHVFFKECPLLKIVTVGDLIDDSNYLDDPTDPPVPFSEGSVEVVDCSKLCDMTLDNISLTFPDDTPPESLKYLSVKNIELGLLVCLTALTKLCILSLNASNLWSSLSLLSQSSVSSHLLSLHLDAIDFTGSPVAELSMPCLTSLTLASFKQKSSPDVLVIKCPQLQSLSLKTYFGSSKQPSSFGRNWEQNWVEGKSLDLSSCTCLKTLAFKNYCPRLTVPWVRDLLRSNPSLLYATDQVDLDLFRKDYFGATTETYDWDLSWPWVISLHEVLSLFKEFKASGEGSMKDGQSQDFVQKWYHVLEELGHIKRRNPT
mmetsp:Transcript_20005/g.32816  ORF Transcript_20005/g.32816 Transcript_20005/m.32816 type:complete len:639 (+) Transcript_20005:11-1927(+)